MKRISLPSSSSPNRWIRLLPLLLILGGAAYGAAHLWRGRLDDRVFVVMPSATVTAAENFNPVAAREFLRLSDSAAGRSLLDPTLLTDLRARYEKSGWVKEVCRVERVFPNQLLIEFIPRRPYYQTAQDGIFCLVDEENVLLPNGETAGAHPQLPIIRGDIAAPPPIGEKWNDDGVLAAYRALRAIGASPLAAQLPVSEITVRRAGFFDRFRQEQKSRPRLEIITHNNIHILWGAEELGVPGEITTADKLAMLERLLTKPPANRKQISLDVRTAIPGYKLRGE